MRKQNLFILTLTVFFFLANFVLAQTYDMWDYMCHDNWSTKYMDGSHKMRNKVKDSNQALLFIKTSDGYPFEYFWLQNSNIYVKYEGMKWPGEQGTTYDKAGTYRFYKIGEFRWCPRYVTHNCTWSTGTYKECWVDACEKDYSTTHSMSGKAVYHSSYSFGGDVGTKACVEVQHVYGSSPSIRESYFYVKEYGLVRWEYRYWNGSSYVLQQSSVFNDEKNGSFNEYTSCWPTEDCDSNW